ncbi:MAG: hypothetical protein KDI83_01635 [Gammaproteobacteria bacterium]|nr:hypothetical protein [Gammaproteobacteria bacterium]
MNRGIDIALRGCISLFVILLAGCTEEKAVTETKAHAQERRIFDTQRSALEQAKETAEAAALRNLQFQERVKEND